MKRILLLAALGLAIAGAAADPKQDQPPKPWALPGDAIAVAMSDAIAVQQADPSAPPFTKWIWLQEPSEENMQAIADVLNRVSRSGNVVGPPTSDRPLRFALPGGILLRFDLRWLYPRAEDLADALQQFENFRFDPAFSLILTKDTVRFLTAEQRAGISVRSVKTMRKWDEKMQRWEVSGKKVVTVPIGELKDFVAERVNSPDAVRAGYEKLQALTLSEAPIIQASYFLGRAASTIKDKDGDKDSVFSLVYGGLYYDLRGVRKAQKGIATDMDQFLFDLGVGSKGEDFRKLFERLGRRYQAAAMFRSMVTGKPRLIFWFAAQSAPLTDSISAVFVTADLRNRDIDLAQHPIANLLRDQAEAYEIIAVGTNGNQVYALFNGAGTLLDKAADEVVSDHSAPVALGGTTELQSGISCIRCHGAHGGWQPFKNDVRTLISWQPINKNLRPGIIADSTNLNEPVAETLDKIRAQYSGDATQLLLRLRQDHNNVVQKAVGVWKASKDQTDLVERSSARISAIWARDRYDQVDAAQALWEIGEVPVAGNELAQLQKLLLPDTPSLLDPRINGLLAGLKINRADWNFAYSFALDQAYRTRNAAGKEKKDEGSSARGWADFARVRASLGK